jgi:hypothetical protein
MKSDPKKFSLNCEQGWVSGFLWLVELLLSKINISGQKLLLFFYQKMINFYQNDQFLPKMINFYQKWLNFTKMINF